MPCGFREAPTRGERALGPTSTPFRRGERDAILVSAEPVVLALAFLGRGDIAEEVATLQRRAGLSGASTASMARNSVIFG